MTHPFPQIFSSECLGLFPLEVGDGGPSSCQTHCQLCSGLQKKEILFPAPGFLAAASGSAPFLGSPCLFPPQPLSQAQGSIFPSTADHYSHTIIKEENNFSPSMG